MVEELWPCEVGEYLCAIAVFFNKARPSTHFEGGRRPLNSHFSGLVDNNEVREKGLPFLKQALDLL